MATQRRPTLGHNTIPDNSGNVFQELHSIKATNAQFDHLVFVFNGGSATADGVRGTFNIPQDYVNGANLVIVWTSTGTTGNSSWGFSYRTAGGTENLDLVGAQEVVALDAAAPAAAYDRVENVISLTDGNFAAGDTVQFELVRDGTEAGNTLTQAALLFDLLFQYEDA